MSEMGIEIDERIGLTTTAFLVGAYGATSLFKVALHRTNGSNLKFDLCIDSTDGMLQLKIEVWQIGTVGATARAWVIKDRRDRWVYSRPLFKTADALNLEHALCLTLKAVGKWIRENARHLESTQIWSYIFSDWIGDNDTKGKIE